MNNQKYSPEYLLKQTAGARASLLAVLIFTVVNLAVHISCSRHLYPFSLPDLPGEWIRICITLA